MDAIPQLLQLASQIDDFKEIAKEIDPTQGVSNQAIHILKSIVSSTYAPIQMNSINFFDIAWGDNNNEDPKTSSGCVDRLGVIKIQEPIFCYLDIRR